MSEDYCQILLEVMRTTKPTVKPVHPTLTYGTIGWEFDGLWYGSDRAAAEAARDSYYSEPNDLEGVL